MNIKLREATKDYTGYLVKYLKKQRGKLKAEHLEGVSGRYIVDRHSSLMDVFIISVHNHVLSKVNFEQCPVEKPYVVLATGGYGRGELSPYSDIALITLYREKVDLHSRYVIEGVLNPLRRTGLRITHALRSIQKCLELAMNDFNVQTSLIDSHVLVGNRVLFKEFWKALYERLLANGARSFLDKVIQENTLRHMKHVGTTYILEPDLNEMEGGLMDIHSMLWMVKVLFGRSVLQDLESCQLLSHDERTSLEVSLDFMLRIKNELHYLGARRNNQLLFEFQEAVAKLWYKNMDDLSAVAILMKDFHDHSSNIESISSRFFERVKDRKKKRESSHYPKCGRQHLRGSMA